MTIVLLVMLIGGIILYVVITLMPRGHMSDDHELQPKPAEDIHDVGHHLEPDVPLQSGNDSDSLKEKLKNNETPKR